MKRLAMIGCCLAAVLAAVAPAALAARPRAVTPPRDALGAIACHQAINPLQRDVSVQATMRPVTGTQTLQIKFSLSLSAPGAPATAVVASGLGQWLTPSDPTLGQRPADIWKLSKPVYNLGGGSYQFSVGFRWLGAKGKVLKTAVLQSSSCAIKELRPDLAVRSVKVRSISGAPSRDRYLAVVVNQGPSPSGPFSLLFDPGVPGVSSQTKPTMSLAGGQSTTVPFIGPACDATSPPTVVADPTAAIDDSNRSNNALTVTCPAG
ncbi:MAG: CARDB domain-containing protein [Solirubrobacteraceae bacterium]